MLKRIHVNQGVIRSNAKHGRAEPAITIKSYRKPENKTHCENEYAHEVEILGPSKLIYRPEQPLPCGAKLWIETEAPVLARLFKEEKEAA